MEIVARALLDFFLLFVGPPLIGVAALVVLVVWQVHFKKWQVGVVGDPADRNRKEKLWTAAFMALADDPSATIVCPECGSESLRIEDAPYPKAPGRVDHCVTCGNCRALRVPPAV